MTISVTILVVLALTLYTLIVTAITQARIERAPCRAKRYALPIPLSLEACPEFLTMKNSFNAGDNGIVVDPNCYDSCDFGIKCLEEQGNPLPNSTKPENEGKDNQPEGSGNEDGSGGTDTDGEPNYEAYDENGDVIESKVVDEDGNITPAMRNVGYLHNCTATTARLVPVVV